MNTIKIKFLFNSTLALAGFICVLLWCFLDYSQRFLGEENKANMNIIKFTPAALQNLKLDLEQKENILSLYQSYLTEEINNEFAKNQMSLTDQLNQQGLLNSLHIKNKQLILKAILKNDKTSITEKQELVALILIIDNLTKEQRIESFQDKSDVFGYQLSIEKNTEVNLSKALPSKTQKITLTMYKTDV